MSPTKPAEGPSAPQSRSTTPGGVRAWAVGKVLVLIVSLGANILTLAQQGAEKWLTSIFQNGKLQVSWKGAEPRTNVQIHAKGDRGEAVVFDVGERISLPAGRYALSVLQSGNELPVVIETPDGSLSTHVEVVQFRTKAARVRLAPADAPFAEAYSDFGDLMAALLRNRGLQLRFLGVASSKSPCACPTRRLSSLLPP